MVKVIRSSVLSARMVPPWSSTISLAMAKPRPAPPVRVARGAVQTEELFKDPVQFLLGDVLSRIGEGEYDFPGLYPSGNFHRAVRQAIIRRIAQEIIKDPCQLIRVTGIVQLGRRSRLHDSPDSAKMGRNSLATCSSIRVRSTLCRSSSRRERLKRVMSKNSLMRSSSRSAFSRAMPVYLARISGEI